MMGYARMPRPFSHYRLHEAGSKKRKIRGARAPRRRVRSCRSGLRRIKYDLLFRGEGGGPLARSKTPVGGEACSRPSPGGMVSFNLTQNFHSKAVARSTSPRPTFYSFIYFGFLISRVESRWSSRSSPPSCAEKFRGW